jgi:hypothetical protein
VEDSSPQRRGYPGNISNRWALSPKDDVGSDEDGGDYDVFYRLGLNWFVFYF